MARSQLSILIRQCLHQRKTPQEFDALLSFATRKWASSGTEVAAGLVQAVFGFCLDDDPLVSGYLQIMITSQHAKVSDCLTTFIMHWQCAVRKADAESTGYGKAMSHLIADITLITSNISPTTQEVRATIILSSRWLQTLFGWTSTEQKHNGEHISLLVNALGAFLITALNTPAGLAALQLVENARDDQMNVAVRKALRAGMTTFPDVTVQLMSAAQKHPALDENTEAESAHGQVAEMAAINFENAIANPQILPSRAATYAFLYTRLLYSSTIDDNALYNFLDTRYSSNTALMFNDLLISSFDALTKPSCSQLPMYQAQCKIFLHNKLPTILAAIASNFQQIPTGQYLQDIWNEQITLANEQVIAIAKHFLHTCALHHLISTDNVQTLIGVDSNTVSAKGLFPKQALVDQVNANASRGPRLIDELAKNDGNAGPFSQAVTEIVHRYCQAKETHHLKDIANALVRQPATINSLGMFIRPGYFLAPLCTLLDEWSWDDIHGESQPMYEEFGSVLLLILTFKFRLGLSDDEVGLTSHTGFIAKYLTSGQSERMLSQMTDGEKDNLSDWIHNLYESEGISDDVTSSCSAKDFYLMVPSLLHQSMTALATGKLSQERLEGGLDYLLEPFLMPSLLSAFSWLSRAVLKDQKHAMIILRRLATPPGNVESSKVHRTILNIAHGVFTAALAHHPDQTQYADIWALFGETAAFSVSSKATAEDIARWTAEAGGVISPLRTAIQDMIAVPSAALYQPKLLITASQIRDPATVVNAMIALLVQSASNGFPHLLLDVVATILACTNLQGISFRNALQLLHARLGTFVKSGERLFAEALIHLYRRVEVYAIALTPQPGAEEQALNSLDGADLAEINLDQIPSEGDASKQQQQQQEQTQQIMQADTLEGENMDQMLNEAAQMSNMDNYGFNEENMFGMEDYELTNIDDLDMTMFT